MSLKQPREILFINRKKLKDLLGKRKDFNEYCFLLNKIIKKILDCSVDKAIKKKLLKVERFLLEECIKEIL